MNPRPGPGVRESLQHRGNGGPSRPLNDAESGHTPAASWSDATRPVPRGRPHVFFTTAAGPALDGGPPPLLAQPASLAHHNTLPLPPRPGFSRVAAAAQQQRMLPGGAGVKDNAASRAPANDAPSPAHLFPGSKTVDLFPWTGNHSEDALSEALIKAGISNKSQIMNETNTARPSLWSNLKNKPGLAHLSSLFVAVLEKRQACGRLTAPNSFKPPPRLTLRDSTREAWLRDLANPSVGLRRLSRTIPHGITGEVLLDQCLQKNIPLPRAVWLAKCVGLNEMRSHKRKGQAGTITWVRGWTSSVEQFLDNSIASIAQPDWKSRLTYALQLATCLYKDRLLEEDHFLDWVLKNLETSSSERLFIWLLVVSVFEPDLTVSRHRGKRLASSLLGHLGKLYDPLVDFESFALLEYLEKMVIKILLSNSDCLLLPKTWDLHNSVLRRLSTRNNHPAVVRATRDLDRRVRRLHSWADDSRPSARDPFNEVISLLDFVDYTNNVDIEFLALRCMELGSDTQLLVSTVIKWASSSHRAGSHRIYLVTRLLRKWSQSGVDIDHMVLLHLNSRDSTTGCDSCYVYRIIAELVRSKTFSVGKYLQWVIATGSLQNSDRSPSSCCPLRLITAIPLSGLSDQVCNLRATLLRGTPHSVEEEEKQFAEAENFMRYRLPGLFGSTAHANAPPETAFAKLSPTVKFELALLLRHRVSTSVQSVIQLSAKMRTLEDPEGVCTISASDFHLVRTYLEDFGDISILADVVGVVATSLDGSVLASAADTVQYHHESFSAIGALRRLFHKIALRYIAIRNTGLPERELLLSLAELSRATDANGQLMQYLANDLSRYEHEPYVAACSPVSDIMPETVCDPAAQLDEEIDRILTRGTNIDRHVVVRIFDRIMAYFEEGITKSVSPSGNLSRWLIRLRSFDAAALDSVVAKWITSIDINRDAKLIGVGLPVLVSSGCITPLQFLRLANQCITERKNAGREEALRVSITVLDLLLPSEGLVALCGLSEAYRYRLVQKRFGLDSAEHLARLIRDTLELGTEPLTPSLQAQISDLLSSDRMHDFAKYLAIHDMPTLLMALGVGTLDLPKGVSLSLKSLIDGLLDPYGTLALPSNSLERQVTSVFRSASLLSVPFCQLELRQLLCMELLNDDTTLGKIACAILDTIKDSVGKDQKRWPDLIPVLGSGLIAKIRNQAERELLNASAFLNNATAKAYDASCRGDDASIQNYLAVIEITTSEVAPDDQFSTFASFVERFKSLAGMLGIPEGPVKESAVIVRHADGSDCSVNSTSSFVCSWINVFLRLAIIHGTTSLHMIPHPHQTALLWSLRLLFTSPVGESYPSMSNLSFDVAMSLHDFVTDDVRGYLAKLDAATSTKDPHCAFLFGRAPVPDGWLALATPIVPPVTVQPPLSAQSQGQASDKPLPSPQSMLQQGQQQTSSLLQRSPSQHLSGQSQHMERIYPPYPQHPHSPYQSTPNAVVSPFQQMTAGAPHNMPKYSLSQMYQMQQLQQMQSLAHSRNMQASPAQLQRQMSSPAQTGCQSSKAGPAKQEILETKTQPFPARQWELLPDNGSNAAANETAISLGLFGTRKL